MRRLISLNLYIILMLQLTPAAPLAQAYKVTLLEFPASLNARSRTPYAINNNGQIVGCYEDGLTFDNYGFVYDNGSVTNLGLYVTPEDINDDGDIVYRRGVNSYLFRNGSETVLLGPNGESVIANSINASGAIVGSYAAAHFAQYVTHALLITGGQATDIGTLEGNDPSLKSWATSINDLGVIVGASETSGAWAFGNPVGRFGFVYESGVMSSLGYLDTISGGRGLNSGANDINSAGVIVGSAQERRAFQWPGSAVIWRDGKIKSLHPSVKLNSCTMAINEAGVVVGGTYQPGLLVTNAAWLWQGGIGMGVPLNSQIPSDADVYLTLAYDINDSGQIICQGLKIVNGAIALDTIFAYLLTPAIKTLTLLDDNGDTLRNVTVQISQVDYNPPVFSETPIGDFTSDQKGQIRLLSDALNSGDSIKVTLKVLSQPAVKNKDVLATMYSVTIDNAQFDRFGFGRVHYDEMDGNFEQTVTLNHTVVAWNFVASIEWDAELDYLQSMMHGFRSMSNYLYDVTDGQMRLDTVVLLDNKDHWGSADMRIHADNTIRPYAYPTGIRKRFVGNINMPRRWFGGSDAGRNRSYSQVPLDMGAPMAYRTKAHEFGHYALGFLDEYQFLPFTSRCQSTPNYGYMDSQYLSTKSDYASELSTQDRYASPDCRNTIHYLFRRMSCWDYAEHVFEGNQGPDNVYVPIIKPSERGLPTGLDFVVGPNDDMHLGPVDVEVGIDVVFPVLHSDPFTLTFDIGVYSLVSGDSVAKATVRQKKQSGKRVKQGKTADNGRIWVLDASIGDKIYSFGRKTIFKGLGKSEGQAASEDGWYFGEATIGGSGVSKFGNLYSTSLSGDSLNIALREIAGYYPFIVDAAFVGTELQLQIDVVNAFSQAPRVEHEPDADTSVTEYTFASTTNAYTVSIGDSLDVNGVFTILAVDDSLSEFFVPISYSFNDIDTTSDSSRVVTGPGGSVGIIVDTTIDSIMFLVSAYPVIRDGLDPESRQAGDAAALVTSPAVFGSDSPRLTIYYEDSDLGDSADIANLESSLRLYRWDSGPMEWVIIGGSVDTAFNEVSAGIDQAGVYAAFTTDISTDVEDGAGEPSLPESFELRQNYPNPFNPNTSISFSLPMASDVKLEIFNILGQSVATLYDGHLRGGVHKYTWDGSSAASGIYLYRLTVGEHIETKKMLLLK